ncbi:MAG: restriction endonuclease subunit S [Muribaculaceae bacterium]
MTKLQHLIDTLCPHGVPFKPLAEIGTFIRGNGLQKKDFTDSGVGCIHYGQIYTHYGTFASKTISFVSEETANNCRKAMPGDLVIAATSENVDDVCKCVAWLGDEEVAISSDAFVFRHNLNPKYVAYYFQSDCFQKQKLPFVTGTKVMRVSSENLAKIIIPIPPMPVQEEIVRILDRFADYSAQLQAELQAELQARKAQYEFYRNHLLAFNDDQIPFKPLGEVFELRNGYTPSKNNPEFWEGGTIPWFRMEDIRENGRILSDAIQHITPAAIKGKGLFEANSFILATTATIGEHALLIADSLANQRFTNLKVRKSLANLLKTKFIYYYMFIVDEFCKNNTNVSGFASVDMDKLKRMPIPIPPIPVQEKIVAILDRFEALVNDLCCGLPAEIEAVNARYEFYRNHLLSFTPLSL